MTKEVKLVGVAAIVTALIVASVGVVLAANHRVAKTRHDILPQVAKTRHDVLPQIEIAKTRHDVLPFFG